jgi:hypothetical protein
VARLNEDEVTVGVTLVKVGALVMLNVCETVELE